MAFLSAQHVDAPRSTFSNVGQNQYNVGTIQLAPAFSAATFIASMVQQVQSCRQQIAALVSSIDTLLKTLDAEYLAGRLLVPQTSGTLQNLNKYVNTHCQRSQ